LVASLNHPGGNLTGFNLFASELGAKRLGRCGSLYRRPRLSPCWSIRLTGLTDILIKDIEAAAAVTGQQIRIVYAKSEREFEPACTPTP